MRNTDNHARNTAVQTVEGVTRLSPLFGQGNPTVATLNRIGEFFGLEVAFVPVRKPASAALSEAATTTPALQIPNLAVLELLREMDGKLHKLQSQLDLVSASRKRTPR